MYMHLTILKGHIKIIYTLASYAILRLINGLAHNVRHAFMLTIRLAG